MIESPKALSEERLLSLDFFRGFTMFLLIAEGTGLFPTARDPYFEGSWISFLGEQFRHHPWNGLRFWDLIQPFFMFIVGVALPFAVARRIERGAGQREILIHVLKRSFILLLLGWGLYCIGPGRITFRFQNVLAQLSVTYLIAYLIMRGPWQAQLAVSAALLLITEIGYRTFPIEGFNEAFVADKNLGAWVDLKISGEINGGHWVSLNAIPTAAHTIWGVMAGQLLMSGRDAKTKVAILVAAGLAGLVIGYGMNPVTPIIKRIATTSFVICTGGWCLLTLAFSYWLIDVMKVRAPVQFFAIVGMNSLFIYLFAHVGGDELIHAIAKPFTMGLFAWADKPQARLATGFVTWAMLWGVCYWLYRRRIFIKI